MKAKDFFDQFIEQIECKLATATKSYLDFKEFTSFVISTISEILDNNDEKFDRGYYRADVFSWIDLKDMLPKQIKKQKPKGLKEYCWIPATVVEHENTYSRWLDEVVKLAYINVPLKVVIGYLPVNEPHNEYIEYVSQIYSFLAERVPFKDDNEFLIMIGNAKTTDEKEYFQYQPYLYDQETKKFQLQSTWIKPIENLVFGDM